MTADYRVYNLAHLVDTKLAHPPLPELRRLGRAAQLIVDGRPFLALGGELGNSTASDLGVLDAALLKCRRMNLNTVMLPVYWDLIETEEGKLDFSLLRGGIDLARRHELRLVLLWFGTWKNGMSCYAPGWMKRDTARFPRVRLSSGEALEVITPCCDAANETDARAFAAMMRWIGEYDAATRTVIMVQVENEIGLMPEPRDYSEQSRRIYESDVPDELLSGLNRGELGPELAAQWERAGRRPRGNWAEVFGSDPQGEEVFSAWQFATYVENLAAAGKREYPLPMFVNAALIRPGYLPGQYASGGPLPHLLELWRAGAPSLDMLCPDIYFPNFSHWCHRFVRNGNPLFIPELAASARAPANAVYAAGRFSAIGFGPFAIQSVSAEREQQIANCYEMLAGLSCRILECQQTGKLIGLSPEISFDWSIADSSQRGELGGVTFEAQFDRGAPSVGEASSTTLPTLGSGRWEAPPGTPCGSAMILQLADEEFAIAAMGATITFSATDAKAKIGIDRVQEGQHDLSGAWRGGRWLNGDETHQGRHVHFPIGRWIVQRVRLYRY